MLRVVQLNFTTEIEVSYMQCERNVSNFSMTSLKPHIVVVCCPQTLNKQHMQYFHPVGPPCSLQKEPHYEMCIYGRFKVICLIRFSHAQSQMHDYCNLFN